MPHRYRSALALSVGLLMLLLNVAPAAEFTPARVAVYFSPHGGATEAVVREVNAATHHILVQAYSFTSAPIVKAAQREPADTLPCSQAWRAAPRRLVRVSRIPERLLG